MAEHGKIRRETFASQFDLRHARWHIVRVSSGGVDVASHSAEASASNWPIGILDDKPSSLAKVTSVAVEGHAKCVAGAAVAKNKWVTNNSSGRGIEASSGDVVIARAYQEADADGEFFGCEVVTPFRLRDSN